MKWIIKHLVGVRGTNESSRDPEILLDLLLGVAGAGDSCGCFRGVVGASCSWLVTDTFLFRVEVEGEVTWDRMYRKQEAGYMVTISSGLACTPWVCDDSSLFLRSAWRDGLV